MEKLKRLFCISNLDFIMCLVIQIIMCNKNNLYYSIAVHCSACVHAIF